MKALGNSLKKRYVLAGKPPTDFVKINKEKISSLQTMKYLTSKTSLGFQGGLNQTTASFDRTTSMLKMEDGGDHN